MAISSNSESLSVRSSQEADVAEQLARQLQTINVTLQDADLDVVLGELMQIVCALYHSRIGVLLLFQPHEQTPAFSTNVVVSDGVTVRRAIADARHHCSHAIIDFRGRVLNLLSASSTPQGPSALEQMDATQQYMTAPLVAGNKVFGQVSVHFASPEELDSTATSAFSDLVAQTAVALDRAVVLQQTRERQLATEALFQTVRDISSSLDLDEVLTTIVRRARKLLNADVAFLSILRPDANETYVRVADGLETESHFASAFRMGAGLGGLAVKRREPVVTEDYFADTAFAHEEHLDAATSAERLVSMLAVPLIVRDEPKGILFVSNRHRKHFGDDDIKLVQSFGSSASMAIEKAWMYEKEKEAVNELQLLNQLVTSQREMYHNSILVHDQLTKLLLNGMGIPEVASTLAGILSNPVAVHDYLLRPLATSGASVEEPWPEGCLLSQLAREPAVAEKLLSLSESRQPARFEDLSKYGLDYPLVVVPIVVGANLLGYLFVVERHHPLDELEQMIAERAATILALEMVKQRAALDVELRLSGDFWEEALTGKYDDEEVLMKKGAHFGFDLNKPRCVVAFSSEETGRQSRGRSGIASASPTVDHVLFDVVGYCARRRFSDAIVTTHRGTVLALLPLPTGNTDNRLSMARELLEDINSGHWQIAASAGIGRPCTCLADYASSHREAIQVLTVLRRLGKPKAVLSFDQLGLLRLFFGREEKRELSEFVSQTVGPLLTYDSRHGSDLVHTLHAYLDANGNAQATARILHVHVNTLLYRLERIRDICDIDLDDAEVRLEFHMACKLLETMDSGDLS